ncbi:MAG: DUF2127 domain-containing protein [Tepidisphaeraceae bacterium]|jgi:uncharacterized membrane protein (DUF2068 family)
MTTATAHAAHSPRLNGRTIVILIGVFKLFKASLLILMAVTAIWLTNPTVNDTVTQWVTDWVTDLAAGPFRKHIGDWIVNSVLGLKVKTLVGLAVGAALYATVFLTEGLGLLFNKIWAEWMAVISTSLLLPVELFATFKHRDNINHVIWGLLAFAGNLAIVIYLFRRVKERIRLHKTAQTLSAASPT